MLSCLGSMSKWEPVTFEESLCFVKKVKVIKFFKIPSPVFTHFCRLHVVFLSQVITVTAICKIGGETPVS